MTRVLQPSHPDTPINHRKVNDVDIHLEEYAPAVLLELNRGAGRERKDREHKPLRDTCTPACTTSPAPVLDCLNCLDCRNGDFGNDIDFYCDSCVVECASPCNDEDCDIPQACFEQHCATECQDNDCEFSSCPVPTCGTEPAICATACFDENCSFPIADGFFGFNPQLCEQGECHRLPSCDPGIWPDFSQSHHFSNHFPSSMFTNNTPLWDHSIPQFHGHHNHDYHSNNHTDHKRRKLDGGSSQNSLHGHNCYEPSYEWPALDINFGSGCGNSSFSFQPQQNAEPAVHLGSGLQSGQFDQTFLSSGNFASDLRAPQAQNQVPFATNFSSPTSNSYLTSSTHFSTPGSSAVFSTPGTNPSTLVQPLATDHERIMAGLTCELGHPDTLDGTLSNMEHDPECRMAGQSSKLTRQRSPPADQLSRVKSETSNYTSTGKRSNRHSMEFSTTCRWAVSGPCNGLEPHICNQTFLSSKELDDHVQKEHTNRLGAQQFTCGWEGCSTSFKHRGKLNRHISGAHSRYHAYSCGHCERTFCTKEQLKNHETTHTGEKKYQCQWCEHRSATKTQHNTHERTHTKVKPYVCPYCDHRSGDSSNLSKHVKNKHPEMRNLPTRQKKRPAVKHEKA